MLGDYGADVVKVEHPRGDGLRSMGWQKDGVSLWWALVGAQQALRDAEAVGPARRRSCMKRLVADADVLIENFRPGTLERWGLGPGRPARDQPEARDGADDGLRPDRPVRHAARASGRSPSRSRASRTSTAGRTGRPRCRRSRSATAIAALTGCFAAMFALWWREHGGEGKGQVIDLSIYEPLFWILGPQALVYDQLGIVQGRTGNRAPFTAPRNAYLAKDGTLARPVRRARSRSPSA